MKRSIRGRFALVSLVAVGALSAGGAVRIVPTELRCATVVELDLMACLAGLRLADRWSSWRKAQFGRASGSHISIYAV